MVLFTVYTLSGISIFSIAWLIINIVVQNAFTDNPFSYPCKKNLKKPGKKLGSFGLLLGLRTEHEVCLTNRL